MQFPKGAQSDFKFLTSVDSGPSTCTIKYKTHPDSATFYWLASFLTLSCFQMSSSLSAWLWWLPVWWRLSSSPICWAALLTALLSLTGSVCLFCKSWAFLFVCLRRLKNQRFQVNSLYVVLQEKYIRNIDFYEFNLCFLTNQTWNWALWWHCEKLRRTRQRRARPFGSWEAWAGTSRPSASRWSSSWVAARAQRIGGRWVSS